ncbi:zinc-binding dehydrogenase [Methylobacterium sp. ID0610]|uniref:zinc-binding dehydrogenase n=1 Tax=Methylobacterium carpenticola TaxID=3344827 RepID=UPI0036CA2C27
MRAALLRAPNDLVLADIHDPAPEPGGLVVRVRAATICGTDIRILTGRKTAGVRFPSVLGHEFSGVVAESRSERFVRGDPVCVNPAIACGACEACQRGRENLCMRLTAMGYELDGAFAELVSVPARAVAAGNVLPLPEGLSFAEAALAEPLACVINGQEKVSLGRGDGVVVLGAGPIGLLHVALARHSGARRIVVSEPNPARRRAALDLGADAVIDPGAEDVSAAVRARCGGSGADVIIAAIGVPHLAQDAVRLARPGGRVSLFAGFTRGETAALDVNAIHYGELIVTGAFGLMRRQFGQALDLLASGRIGAAPLLSHRFPLDGAADALRLAASGAALKVAIEG